MPRRLSSHHAQRRYKAAILDHPASGTAIAERGRLNWQAATGYGKRALIETTMGRYKALCRAAVNYKNAESVISMS
jgi:hypothetical protein